MYISTLKANLSSPEAMRKLRGTARQLKRGALVNVMCFYLPYRFYRVRLENGNQRSQRLIAMDAVCGQLDLYDFDKLPAAEACEEIDTDHFAPVSLDDEVALAMLSEKLKRQVYRQGFFKVRGLKVTPECVAILYLPYYVGLYKRGERVMIDAIDGLRARFEGAKVRDLITEWFQSAL